MMLKIWIEIDYFFSRRPAAEIGDTEISSDGIRMRSLAYRGLHIQDSIPSQRDPFWKSIYVCNLHPALLQKGICSKRSKLYENQTNLVSVSIPSTPKKNNLISASQVNAIVRNEKTPDPIGSNVCWYTGTIWIPISKAAKLLIDNNDCHSIKTTPMGNLFQIIISEMHAYSAYVQHTSIHKIRHISLAHAPQAAQLSRHYRICPRPDCVATL